MVENLHPRLFRITKDAKIHKTTMRTIRTLFLVAMACIAKAIDTTGGLGLVLSEKVMKLVHTSAILSALAYEENPPHGDFQHFGYYDSEPDQALVAKYKGYCYGAYRGTTLTWDDWQQNLVIGNHQVCGVNETVCCSTRLGFWQAYDTDYRAEMEEALEACAAECENPKECVVLTGHSQGGAIAAVAGLNLAHLDPYVITFGQPATIDQPCGLITSERWYRFINTKASSTRAIGIVYDPVPFVPGLGADHFGNAILLSSEDSSGVAYMGLDAQEAFGPLNINGFEAHSMSANASAEDYTPGYLDQIGALLEYYATNQTYPVRTTGYKIGSLCSQDIECETNLCQRDTTFSYRRCAGLDCKEDTECPETGRCDNGVCLPRLGSCMECNEGRLAPHVKPLEMTQHMLTHRRSGRLGLPLEQVLLEFSMRR